MLKKTEKNTEKLKELDSLLTDSLNQAQENRIVKGMVLEVRPTEVLVDVGGKSEGAIPASEFEDISTVKAGDEVDVLIIQSENDDGMVVLSKKLADEKIKWEAVFQRYQEGSVVKGLVKSKVRGGLIVDVDGVEAFLPGSQIDITPVHEPDGFVGNEYDFKLIKIVPERHNIILSRRELLEEQLAVKRRELLDTLVIGERRKGKVKNITDFGVFVDLDGIDGLLHITDLSWGRVRHPTDVVQQGQELEVVILDVDRERGRVSLGLKQAQENPWDAIEVRYPVNARLRGKVVNLVPYGAFSSSPASRASSTSPSSPGRATSRAPATCSRWATRSTWSSSRSTRRTRRSPSASARRRRTPGTASASATPSAPASRARSATSPATAPSSSWRTASTA